MGEDGKASNGAAAVLERPDVGGAVGPRQHALAVGLTADEQPDVRGAVGPRERAVAVAVEETEERAEALRLLLRLERDAREQIGSWLDGVHEDGLSAGAVVVIDVVVVVDDVVVVVCCCRCC